MRSRRARPPAPSLPQLEREDGQERPELDLGLRQLGGGVGVADNADARVAAGLAAAEKSAAEADAELAVLARVGPADRARVPAAVEALEHRDDLDAGGVRLGAHGGGRVQVAGELERAD